MPIHTVSAAAPAMAPQHAHAHAHAHADAHGAQASLVVLDEGFASQTEQPLRDDVRSARRVHAMPSVTASRRARCKASLARHMAPLRR